METSVVSFSCGIVFRTTTDARAADAVDRRRVLQFRHVGDLEQDAVVFPDPTGPMIQV